MSLDKLLKMSSTSRASQPPITFARLKNYHLNSKTAFISHSPISRVSFNHQSRLSSDRALNHITHLNIFCKIFTKPPIREKKHEYLLFSISRGVQFLFQGRAQSTKCKGASTIGGDHLKRGCIIGASIGAPGKPMGPAAKAGCIAAPGGRAPSIPVKITARVTILVS